MGQGPRIARAWAAAFSREIRFEKLIIENWKVRNFRVEAGGTKKSGQVRIFEVRRNCLIFLPRDSATEYGWKKCLFCRKSEFFLMWVASDVRIEWHPYKLFNLLDRFFL